MLTLEEFTGVNGIRLEQFDEVFIRPVWVNNVARAGRLFIQINLERVSLATGSNFVIADSLGTLDDGGPIKRAGFSGLAGIGHCGDLSKSGEFIHIASTLATTLATLPTANLDRSAKPDKSPKDCQRKKENKRYCTNQQVQDMVRTLTEYDHIASAILTETAFFHLGHFCESLDQVGYSLISTGLTGPTPKL